MVMADRKVVAMVKADPELVAMVKADPATAMADPAMVKADLVMVAGYPKSQESQREHLAYETKAVVLMRSACNSSAGT